MNTPSSSKPTRYTIYKCSFDDNLNRRDFKFNVTAKELQDLPLSVQEDRIGKYFWSFYVQTIGDVK